MLPHDRSVFETNISAVYGRPGRDWLDQLPDRIAELEGLWSISVGSPYELSFNYVAPATGPAGQRWVLKLAVPGHPALPREAAALGAYAGGPAVGLVAHDDDRSALLLERAVPGRTLADLLTRSGMSARADLAATRATVGVMQALWREAEDGFRFTDLADYRADVRAHREVHGSTGAIPADLLDQALAAFDRQVDSRAELVLCHGDLHQHNVLSAQVGRGGARATSRNWLAIDPHGVLGDPGFDVGALFYNPIGASAEQLVRLAPDRVRGISAVLGWPESRVRDWALFMCVLCEVWTAEDGTPPDGRPLAVARYLTRH